jgi:serine/threonine protein kinase
MMKTEGSSMHDEDRLVEVLQRWEELLTQDQNISPEELCADCPEQLEEVRRAIRTIRRVDTLLDPNRTIWTDSDAKEARGESEHFHQGTPRTHELEAWQFHRSLGKGGFGEVWLARHPVLGLRAIKLLSRDAYGQRNIDRLAEEARKMAGLPKHRNRVQIHDFVIGTSNGYLIMEYVEGGSLRKHTSPANPMPWERAARYVGDVADALAEVHAAGLLHRDIKPANILWDSRHDEAVLADYGLAAKVEEAHGITGTPGYIAPELDGGAASPQSDVFSLAATLFCLVTGRPPFDDRDTLSSLRQARAGLQRPMHALSKVPKAIEDAILEGLEPEPSRRPDLGTFTARLRGAHLQALADKLLELSRRCACTINLRLTVSTASEDNPVFRPVAAETQAIEPNRETEYVPQAAPVASVRTGDLVRLDVTADANGYLTVLNLGSSGELKVLFPNPLARDNRIWAGRAHRLTLKLTPPDGTDRAAVIWTSQPNRMTMAEWRSRIEAGQMAAAPPEEATRGMDFVLHEASEQPADAWTASVVAITHIDP